ncbi:MAG: glucokinase, family [Bacteroidetes bacterium]|nr:glucokinase, family [Bacteroidota bacterium]
MKIFAGIDIGGTTMNIGLVSEDGQVLDETVVPTCPEKGPEDALNRIAESLKQMLAAHRKKDCRGIGIGIPGLIDTDKGCILEASNLPGWESFSIIGHLSAKMNMPVFIENDANLAALGEYWLGAGHGADNLFMVTLGSGIGGAILAGGKILKMHPSAGEFGHMIIERSGATCTCGRRGCLETYISKHGFERMFREKQSGYPMSSVKPAENEPVSPQLLAEHASHGDILANLIFLEAGEALGIAISNVINLTGVTCILVGGGIANAWDLLQEPVMRSVERNVFKSILSGVSVCKAALGEKAGFMGAARLAVDSVSKHAREVL